MSCFKNKWHLYQLAGPDISAFAILCDTLYTVNFLTFPLTI